MLNGIEDYCIVGWMDIDPAHGKIVFNGEGQQVFVSESCNNNKNLVSPIVGNQCGLEERRLTDRVEYVYEITNEDYDSAEPVD